MSGPAARAFYEIEAERENWSTPHLERQIFTALHLRLLKIRNKAGVMELARKGQTVERPSDLIKSPLILDFLGLSGRHEYRESDLETAIISKLSQFLLELGKGFAFVARQKRISFDDAARCQAAGAREGAQEMTTAPSSILVSPHLAPREGRLYNRAVPESEATSWGTRTRRRRSATSR